MGTGPSSEAPPSPRWAFLSGFQVRKDGRPYLDRLRIVQSPWFGVLLHRIHTPDEDRDPHDHPWPFVTLVLSGSYSELVWDNPAGIGKSGSSARHREHPRFSLRRVRLSQAHKITHIEGVLWTLVLTGRRQPSWRFWTAGGPVDWKDYLARGEDSTADWP